MKRSDYITYALLGLGGWLLYTRLKRSVGALTAPIASTIADAYLALTSPPGVQVTGNVILPDGTSVALQGLPGLLPDVSGNVYFTWGGAGSRYQILPGWDANGDRHAVSA